MRGYHDRAIENRWSGMGLPGSHRASGLTFYPGPEVSSVINLHCLFTWFLLSKLIKILTIVQKYVLGELTCTISLFMHLFTFLLINL